MASSSSRKKYLLLCAVILAIAIAAILKAYGRGNADASEAGATANRVAAVTQASLTVSVEKVRKDEIAAVITATGTAQAWQEAMIGAQTSGLQLTEILVAEGDHVSKGEVIARLDDAVLKAQLAEQKAAIEQARATLEAAETAAARARKLIASNAISAETAEERATTVRTSQAQLAQAEAAADNIAAQLARTEIHAPFDGTVSTRPAVAGSIVQSGTELMRIVRDGKVEVAVQVPEKDLAAITTDQAATITDASGRVFSGRVSSIAEKVDGTTRLGTVYVAPLDNSGLRPGMFARVSIATSAAEVLNVAESALTWRDGRPGVFVVGKDGKVAARRVETDSRKDGRVAIASGLAEGESVVVSGAGLLNDGNLVRVAAGDSDKAVSSTETVR
ncbi:efflux RND transporter periplasmic adaptor subunit [Mesorhizobium sp. YC-39]|uniref:efflux RND transporter periplasmic adaptor subunit n=1 Tax=unclassified Mesorhizobium TaxID=325217 RepID=UPI0021E7C73A|nr:MULTISPECIES: efflux RND transporter periplasmic adaptor subunit [unclassified Mesorhizobium]MCV3208126.1 efflux RND transporter periplasmic adaptor subunit [Mesorhizobium sp. YC-2]MCV3229853.1 efflux RND transporter periplasmic adaptor subunit [Mesorhizobium sp. YC-39]